jgi:ferric-dicitrate binding protein FerR (iron transport regulator)
VADENNLEIERDPLLQAAAEWSVELASEEISLIRIAQWQQWLAASEAGLPLAWPQVSSPFSWRRQLCSSSARRSSNRQSRS